MWALKMQLEDKRATAEAVYELIRQRINPLKNGGALAKTPEVESKIIAKIEDQEGVKNIDEILLECDGLMVARGDLGIEIEIETLPVHQRNIVKMCKANGKYVIVATHMLESMIENPFPTRAEVGDIFNALVQKTDAIMLSGETTIGKFPVESVDIPKGI
mgnify:CR=1 FL=1